MPAPHRVLRDSELAATRLVDAARAAVALDPCASCDGSRRARRRRRDDRARGAGRVAARARRRARRLDDRVRGVSHADKRERRRARVDRDAIRRGERAVARRVGSDLDAARRRRTRSRARRSRRRTRGGTRRARARGTTREGANSRANRRRDASDGDDSARARRFGARAAVLLICDIDAMT